MQGKALDFFLGSLSPSGFHSYFKNAYPQLEHGTVLLLKAGPGCGKSQLLSRIGQKLLDCGETVERIHCSAHPSSLDGVICQRLHFAVFDATEPHILEPDYPLAFERVISLDSFLNPVRLAQNRRQIAEFSEQSRRASERSVRYLSAAACLLQDTERTVLGCTDTAKVKQFARTLARRYFSQPGSGAWEDIRLLSAITPDQITLFKQTVSQLAENIVVLDDPYGAAGRLLMQELRQIALSFQNHIITCYCPFEPYGKIDHLFLPEQNTAFVLSSAYLPLEFDSQRTVHATRFMNHNGLMLRKKRIRFNQKATRDLIRQACKLYREAQQARSALKACYASASRQEEFDCELSRLEKTILSSL